MHEMQTHQCWIHIAIQKLLLIIRCAMMILNTTTVGGSSHTKRPSESREINDDIYFECSITLIYNECYRVAIVKGQLQK